MIKKKKKHIIILTNLTLTEIQFMLIETIGVIGVVFYGSYNSLLN